MPLSRLMSLSRLFILLAGLALANFASSQEAGYSNDPAQGKIGSTQNTSVVVKETANPRDPLEAYNRSMYQFNEGVDKAVVKPLAKTYNYILPEPVRKMVSNFFGNLYDIRTTFNDLLQLKFDQAGNDAGRVIINSTFGILGLFDVADHLEKHDEDFGQTLGYWGVKSGPYFVLPILGPRNVRDTVGFIVDVFTNLNPIGWLDYVPARNILYGTLWVDTRAGLLDSEQIVDEAAVDRYSFIRDGYMQRRQNLVYDGDPPREKFDDEEFYDEETEKLPDDTSVQQNPAAPADTSAPMDPAGPADAASASNESSDRNQGTSQPETSGISVILTLPAESEQPTQQPASTPTPASPSSFNPYQTEPLNVLDRESNP